MIRSRVLLPILGLVTLFCASGTVAGEPQNPLRSRREFALAMGKVKEGMSERRVVELLGRPDDVRTVHDLDGISTTETREIWRYGTSGHLTPATLGQIYIDNQGNVQYAYGGGGDLPPDDIFTEPELRRLIGTLAEVPSYNAGSRCNPLKVIRAVNLLQPLGKEKALAAVREFLRVSSTFDDDGREGMFLVLRVLFDVPSDPGYFPPMCVGGPSPEPPKDPKLLPRFPIAIVGDVPLVLVSGYTLGGRPEQPESALDYFRKNGKLRSKPLVPTDTPIKAVDEFVKSPQWIFARSKDQPADRDQRSENAERDLLREQVLRMLDSVYRVEPDGHGGLLPCNCDDKDESRHEEILAKAAKLKIRWDAKLEKYTFLDGTSLPEVAAKLYRREVWRPTVPGSVLEISLARQNPRFVDAGITEDGVSSKPVAIKVWDIAVKNEPVATIEAGSAEQKRQSPFTELTTTNGGHVTKVSSRQFALADGRQIKVEVIVDGKSQFSPIFKP